MVKYFFFLPIDNKIIIEPMLCGRYMYEPPWSLVIFSAVVSAFWDVCHYTTYECAVVGIVVGRRICLATDKGRHEALG